MRASRNSNIIVESDCPLVIKELQQLEDSFSAFGNLMHDIVKILCLSLRNVNFNLQIVWEMRQYIVLLDMLGM